MSGGTPTMWQAHRHTEPTEHRAGTYVYGDRATDRAGAVTLDQCAMRILTTVISRPTADRAILDGGSKTFTSDTFDFSVSYDPEIWSLSSQAPNADGEEFLRFTHETATQVYVIATNAFDADDLEGCLEGAFERYGWDSTGELLFGNATDIDVNDESASFFIPAATSIVGTTAALRGECRAMGDGVLTIFAYLPADEPDVIPADTLEIANELIDGIVI